MEQINMVLFHIIDSAKPNYQLMRANSKCDSCLKLIGYQTGGLPYVSKVQLSYSD